MNPPIHHAAHEGYSQASATYEKARPSYPPKAISLLAKTLGLRAGREVLDLAAGTGKLTRLIAPFGCRLSALEPVAAMRATLAEKIPNVAFIDGSAETIAAPDASFDAVLVGQAYHWFDAPRATAEIRRVLRRGGGIGLLWNVRDESHDWVAQLTAIMDPHEKGTPRYRSSRWRESFDGNPRFSPLESAVFSHAHLGPRSAIVERVLSISFIAALPETARAEVARQVESLLATHPDTRGHNELTLPYRTEVFWSFAR